MLNFIFILIICLLIAVSVGITCRFLVKKEWRKAIFSAVLTIFTPIETFLFIQQRDAMNQTEIAYMIEQIKQMNLYAYLILFLYLLLFSNIIYYFFKRKVVNQ